MLLYVEQAFDACTTASQSRSRHSVCLPRTFFASAPDFLLHRLLAYSNVAAGDPLARASFMAAECMAGNVQKSK